MKIAIPTNDNLTVAEHFGRCEFYVCFDKMGERIGKFKNTSSHMGGVGLPPEVLNNNQVDVLLCKDIGTNAIRLCVEAKIEVYKDKNASTLEKIVEDFKIGKLEKATLNSACESHK